MPVNNGRGRTKTVAHFIPVPSSLIREWGRMAIHNIPYNGPTVQEETTMAVFHVKSPLNAGGGSDIVSLEGGVSEAKCRAAEGPVLSEFSCRDIIRQNDVS